MMRYRFVALDLDNTLLATDQDVVTNMEQMVAAKQWGDPKEMARSFQESNQYCWKLFDQGVIDRQELYRLRFSLWAEKWGLRLDPEETHHVYMKALEQSVTPVPGARAFLQALQEEGARLYIASNGLLSAQEARLQKAGMRPYFEGIYVSSAMDARKPEKAFFQAVWRGMGGPPRERVLFVGDHYQNDIAGAQAFGFDTAWLRPGPVAGQHADYEASSLTLLAQKIL